MSAADLPTVSLVPGQRIRVQGKAPLKLGYDKARSYYQITAPGTYVPPVTPPPPPPPITPVAKVVQASSIAALKGFLADDSVDEIDFVAGTYPVSASGARVSDSLWIGAAFAARKRPILVKPLTAGAVAFDGQGVAGSTWITFAEGAHDQTWQGFRPINMHPVSTGLCVFGGHPDMVPPHDLVLRDITVDTSNRRSSAASNQEHAFYFAAALADGPHDILIDNPTIDGTDNAAAGVYGLWAGIHMDHGDASAPASHHITVRNLSTFGLNYPIILWTPPTHDWLFDGATIKNSRDRAIRFESIGAANIAFRNVISTGSAGGGFYSSMGPNPPGVTFTGCSLA